MLEANGDSYSDYERVSAMTGLPTVLGWYVHEWLWRGDPADLNVRAEDVKQMYTSTDTNEVLRLLEQYHVTYIFVGSKEKEKYGDALNESLLQSIGDIVYQDTASGTYILQVQDTEQKQEKRTAGCGIFSPVFHIIQRMQKKVRRADHAEIPKSAARSSAASGCDNGGYSVCRAGTV